MGFFDALSRGLERSREALNEVFYFGGEVDEDFWEDLEDTCKTWLGSGVTDVRYLRFKCVPSFPQK